MRLPLAALVLGLATGEALVTATLGVLSRGSFASTSLATLSALAVTIAAVGLPVWLLDALATTPGVRALGTGLHRALGAGGSVSLAWLLGGAALGAALIVTVAIAPEYSDAMSDRFALVATVGTAIVASVLAIAMAAALGHAVGGRLTPTRLLARAVDRGLAPALGALACGMLAGLLIGPRYVAAPTLGLVAFTLALFARAPERRLFRAPAGAIAVSLLALGALEWLPPSAAELIAYRAPYASLALGLGQRTVDRDGDGFSPILLGGDCNDRDKRIHPDARDQPDNGIDENCNGTDAPTYRPPTPAASERARYPAGFADKHDIVLVLMDGLRPDHLSLAGYSRKTSPNIDALAREGTWFKNAYTTAPSTRYAMASLFTGRDVRRLDYRDTRGNNFRLNAGAPTIARRLSAAGYRSVGFTVTYVVQHNLGTGQGFAVWKTPWSLSRWKTVGKHKAVETTDAAIAELGRTRGDRRLLLFAHYYCTHDPFYLYPPHDFGPRELDLYDSGIAHCDEQFGRLLEALRKRPSWDRTAVFVVSDHGELFGEHGLDGHGNSLYEPDVRVTLVARVPHAPHAVVEQPVQLHWVAPTLLELASLSPDHDADSTSLLDAILGVAAPAQRPLFTFTRLKRGSTRYSASAVLQWPHKFIRDHRSRTAALYDVSADPGETRSLVDEKPALAARLSDLLEGYESWLTKE